jgi:mycofactocin biosynthetic radical S-adenosylmethionine protein MftC
MAVSPSSAPAAARRPPLVLIRQHFGCLVFDRRTSRYLPFDRPTTDLLLRLREVPVDVALHEAEPDRRPEVERFYDHFYDRGFFTVQGRFAGEVLPVEAPEDHLVGPLALHLEVIAACNLTCRHCFAGTLPRKEKPLALAEMDQLFAEMASLGTYRLGLTGGEPLLRKEIFAILDLATGHGLHPCLTTNGLLITEGIAREFGRRELVWLNVSLEGATAPTNDCIRGAGTFDRVIEQLRLLGRHARFTLAFTIMRTNLHEIGACVELAREVGAHTAVFRPLYPVGVARDHLDLMPTFAEYNEALSLLAEMQGEDRFDLSPIDPFSPHLRREKQSTIHQNYGCGAGNSVCSVSVSGDVNPCSFLGPEFAAGNLRERSLREIWHESAGFQRIRSLPTEEPSSPSGRNARFAGGCRARALVLNGSVTAPDPWITAQVHAERGDATANVYNPLVVLDVPVGSGA